MNNALITPAPVQAVSGESMTFTGQLSRDRYIREQRAYGWEVFLNLQGTARNGTELYTITRRKL
jgi:hypothetical protein